MGWSAKLHWAVQQIAVLDLAERGAFSLLLGLERTDMECFGILFSIPVAFAASAGYTFFLKYVLIKFPRISALFVFVSFVVLVGFIAEIILLVAYGSLSIYGFFGPLFYHAHTLIFFLGTPALANILCLRFLKGHDRVFDWLGPIAFCTVFAFVVVMLQYGVSESLFGIDGNNGPYSNPILK
jgi:hypothetical protein